MFKGRQRKRRAQRETKTERGDEVSSAFSVQMERMSLDEKQKRNITNYKKGQQENVNTLPTEMYLTK